MELPQPHPYGTQGRKPTHNFLSLYSPAQQDPSSTPGSYLETHDFLQPLEQRVGKNVVKEGTAVEHILPGGIGTYSISHVACQSQTQSQRMARPEGVVITAAQSSGSDKNDENSNCSSYSGFSLWEESAVTKGKTGKENIIAGSRRSVIREGGMKMGGVPWMTSASSSAHNRQTTTISSLSSSRPLPAQRNASFGDMLNSAKGSQEDEDDEIGEFVIKKEPSSHYNDVLSVKTDTAHHDQKPNTPRSKHSATEQRRRSKINDRFSMLRELIPHGDQKRDKASFLLEVIEYIQFLQEKVHKYEDSWNNNSNQRPTEGFIEQPRVQPVMSDPPLVTKTNRPLNHPKKGQILSDSDLTPRDQIGQHARSTNKASPFLSPLQSNIHSSESAPLPSTLAAESSSQLWQTKSLKDQEVSIESGTISISTIYSQGLLSTLTQTLQNAGVDLSQANISVQIDLGKRANPSTTTLKKNEVCGMDETMARARLASAREEKSEPPALKRFKTNRN